MGSLEQRVVFILGAADLQALSCHLPLTLSWDWESPLPVCCGPLKVQQAPGKGQEATLSSLCAFLH